jgi:hypothetical protein
MSHDTEETSSKRKFRKYDTAIDTSCAFETNGWHISEKGGAYTNQGPSRDKDSTINDSMTYTVIKMNNSMIKKNTLEFLIIYGTCLRFQDFQWKILACLLI